MCGIAGIYNLNLDAVHQKHVQRMADALAHRGPDGEGIFVDGNIGLGHRRLAILDTTSLGAQPMTSKNDEWVIVFNGCIYNFKELREELKQQGHSFISRTDTEVISEGLAAYGPDFFQRLDGMFAIAAWNKKQKTLYLGRDRFGIKPLYYWFNGKTLVFASEIKAIITHPDYKIGVDHGALNQYFSFQNVFSFNTLFEGVTMLPPANTVVVNSDSTFVKHYSWWDYDFTKADNNMSFDDAVGLTKSAFEMPCIAK